MGVSYALAFSIALWQYVVMVFALRVRGFGLEVSVATASLLELCASAPARAYQRGAS